MNPAMDAQTHRRIQRRAPVDESHLPADLPPVLRRIFAARGVTSAQDLDPGLQHLLRGDSLLGMPGAVDLLVHALKVQERIVFVADFDADGATSCALGIRALRALGARHVDYVVPNRFEYGYGLTPPIVDLVRGKGADLLITVDNGISSVEGVAAARAAGLKILVTDHHLPGLYLPEAQAIVNPNLPGDPFPSKALAGVGVIFYVMLALRARLRENGWFTQQGIAEPNPAEFLDLVALGTVADVVPLDANNRRLVAQGLARLRAGRGQAGIHALIRAGGRDASRLQASDLGFAVGPRLNAAGRLSDMSLGIECLLSDDPQRCTVMARELDALNLARREIEKETREQALDQVLLEFSLEGDVPAGICVFDPTWHQGVIGIVAGRVKDRHHRPVIAFAMAGDDELKGSARSIPGVHIRDVLDTVAARHPSLLTRFGGHAMAAGLSLPLAHLEVFSRAFAAVLEEQVDPALLAPSVWSDGPLPAEDLTLDLAQRIAAAGPWGQAFPEPLFDDVFRVRQRRVVGQDHLRLQLEIGARTLPAIAFNAAASAWAESATRIHAAYRLSVNHYQGSVELQLVIEHAEPA